MIENNSPEYREAIIAAVKEALGVASTTDSYEELLSGRLVGALLKRGLRIYPIEFGYPRERERFEREIPKDTPKPKLL